MAKYEGSVPYTGFIAPADDTDTFNVTDERFNKGGYRSVINQVERLAITPERRKEGMLVKQLDTGGYWTLEGGIENINWELVEFAGADLEGVLKGKGTADRLSKFTGEGTLGNSSIRDDGGIVAIGEEAPIGLEVYGEIYVSDRVYVEGNISADDVTIRGLTANKLVATDADTNLISIDLPPEGVSTIVPTVESFADAFRQIYVRNAEFDNVNNLAEETLWRVTAHDSVNKWLTLDNPIPRLEGLLDINPAKQWGLYRDSYKACNIAEVDWGNNRVRYTATDDTGGVGLNDYVSFFNPFIRAELISRSPLFSSEGAWSATYTQCDSIWKHSDGSYRLVVNGRAADAKQRVGLLKSNNLLDWEWINGSTFKYEKLNTSWSDTAGMILSHSPIRYGKDYIAMAMGYTTGWNSGWIIFDEDFNIKHAAPEALVIPGVLKPQYNISTLTQFEGKWHAFVVHRSDPLQVNWKIYHIVYRDILNYVVESHELLVESADDSSWAGDHVDTACGIVYKGELWCFIGGTGKRGEAFNLLSNKRSMGLMKYDKIFNRWSTDSRSPVLANPIEGEHWWGMDIKYATGHMGGYFAHIIEDNIFYLFCSFSDGLHTYEPNGFKVPLTLDY